MGEGTVTYADGSVMSLECHEDRHGECPDDHSDGSDGNGSLDGYNCECSCSGAETIAALRPLQERAPEVAELVAAIRRDGGFGPTLEPFERSDVIAELVTQWLDANGYEMGAPADVTHTDAGALDAITEMLRDPEWGVGMLEDIAELVKGTGRTVENYEDDRPTWERH